MSTLAARASPQDDAVAGRVAGSAVNLAGQFGATTLLSVASTIAITRLLGPAGYGVYGSAMATFAVLGSAADFGFSIMLSRDMADDPAGHRPLLRAAYEVAGVWSLILAFVMVGMAFGAPIGSQRGLALLVLAPAMALNGLNPASSLFLVTYRASRLVRINVIMASVQVVGVVSVAAAHLGPVAVAAVVSVGSIGGNVIVAVVAKRMLAPGGARFSRRELIRRSAPLGILSIMTRIYLTIDLVLLGWYVSGPKLGDYAAASKILTVLAGLSGAVLSAALPALSSSAQDPDGLARLSERVWHWLVVSAVPMFVGLALFGPLLVSLSIGHQYRGAVPLIRILCIAGGISVMSNLVGNAMVASRKTRPLFVQNSLAIVVNVAGNIILIPRYGVYAAAWLTVVTEALVCVAAMYSLRRELRFARIAHISARPVVAIVVTSAVSIAFVRSQWIGLPVSAALFLVAVTVLRAWPREFQVGGWLSARFARSS